MRDVIKIVLLVAAVAILGGIAYEIYKTFPPKNAAINSYDDCAKAEYPIMESYPERCAAPDGRTFANPNQQAPEAPSADTQPHLPSHTIQIQTMQN